MSLALGTDNDPLRKRRRPPSPDLRGKEGESEAAADEGAQSSNPRHPSSKRERTGDERHILWCSGCSGCPGCREVLASRGSTCVKGRAKGRLRAPSCMRKTGDKEAASSTEEVDAEAEAASESRPKAERQGSSSTETTLEELSVALSDDEADRELKTFADSSAGASKHPLDLLSLPECISIKICSFLQVGEVLGLSSLCKKACFFTANDKMPAASGYFKLPPRFQFSDLSTVRLQVSRVFSSLSRAMMTRVADLRAYWGPEEALSGMIRGCSGSLRSLDIRESSHLGLSVLASINACTDMETLRIGGCNRLLCSFCPRLNPNVPPDARMHLLDLNLGNGTELKRAMVDREAKQRKLFRAQRAAGGGVHLLLLKKLQTLDLSGCRNLSKMSLWFLTHYPGISLTKLNLSNTSACDSCVFVLSHTCPKLENLVLSHTRVTDAAAEHLSRGCKNLKVLDLSYCSSISDQTLFSFINMIHPGINLTCDADNAQLLRLPKLQMLLLEGSNGITFWGLRGFVSVAKVTILL
mmetsp:Transcript_28543/g.39746  ORF Transcript_28543/g.39746 Transcript_28543/m.39746 type:complete len:525 (+) Transcript_28543:324-1898(+)